MPVTARLLQRLHETLGDGATDDLLAWWEGSMVGRAEFQALLDSSLRRQGAELGARIASVDSALRTEIAALRSEVRTDMANLRAEMAGHRADLMKWMFIFWAGTVIPLAGLMIALSRLTR